MPNQEHNCTGWLIQYSYAVDYYFMNYIVHFFALILPRKVQYIVLPSYMIVLMVAQYNAQGKVQGYIEQTTWLAVLMGAEKCKLLELLSLTLWG